MEAGERPLSSRHRRNILQRSRHSSWRPRCYSKEVLNIPVWTEREREREIGVASTLPRPTHVSGYAMLARRFYRSCQRKSESFWSANGIDRIQGRRRTASFLAFGRHGPPLACERQSDSVVNARHGFRDVRARGSLCGLDRQTLRQIPTPAAIPKR